MPATAQSTPPHPRASAPGRVQAVTLGEHAAVERDGRQQQRQPEGGGALFAVLLRQRRRRPRQKRIPDEGNRLHRVERRHGQPRDDKQDVLIQHVVFADVLAHPLGERTARQFLQPIGQINLVIAGGALQKADPRQHGRRAERAQQQRAQRPLLVLARNLHREDEHRRQRQAHHNRRRRVMPQRKRACHHHARKAQQHQRGAGDSRRAAAGLRDQTAQALIQRVKRRFHRSAPP